MTRDQQSGHDYARVPTVWISCHRLPQQVLGFVPIIFSSGDQRARQFDARMHVTWKEAQHLAQCRFARFPVALNQEPVRPEHPAIAIRRFPDQGTFDHESESSHIDLTELTVFQQAATEIV